MSNIAIAKRIEPLEGRAFATNGISLLPAHAATRIVLRARQKGIAVASKVLGYKALNTKVKTTQLGKTNLAMCISPDEWLIIDEEASVLPAKFAKLGNADLSAVEVSHRNTAIIVSGPKAVDVLNSGCPQDLSLAAFPIEAASRTVLGKAEIVLYRMGETDFRVEVWRSFSDYAWKYLVDAAKSA